ncbi:MAG: transglycosylase SLT domain-containing protein [Bacteroidota bacterium]
MILPILLAVSFFDFGDGVNPKGGDTAACNLNLEIVAIDSMLIAYNGLLFLPGDTAGIDPATSSGMSAVYRERLEILDDETPIELDYNEVVERYIEMYLNEKKGMVSKMLGTSKLYFPLFEETLDKYDLPLELKYLAIVESALNPLARSRSGAIGLWQLMYNTAIMLGLNITSYVDERRDPVKSTEAACQYLEFLYNTFGDWQLALAAYNGGPGVVKNAIERSGGKTDFWELRPYLPDQTKGYVPAFIAVNYIMEFSKEHDILAEIPKFAYYQTDTVMIARSLSFDNIANTLNIPLTTIRFLNPTFKQNYIPQSVLPCPLVLPVDRIMDFIRKEKEIYGDEKPVTAKEIISEPDDLVKIMHTVSKGEYLHIIGLKYKCSTEDIKFWNGLTGDNLSTGQQLVIWIDRKNAYRYNNVIDAGPLKTNADGYIYYTFQEGDKLEDIALHLTNLTVEEILKLNDISDPTVVKPGTRLKIAYR